MSSGHGISGGVGRCYPFFAEFKECLVSLIGSGEAGLLKSVRKLGNRLMFMSVTSIEYPFFWLFIYFVLMD